MPYVGSGLRLTLPSREERPFGIRHGAFAENIPIVEIVLEDHYA